MKDEIKDIIAFVLQYLQQGWQKQDIESLDRWAEVLL